MYQVSMFERFMTMVNPLPQEYIEEAMEMDLEELLLFCADKGCFTLLHAHVLYGGLVFFKSEDSAEWEYNYNRLHELLKKLGLPTQALLKFIH